ncbi:MAG: asparagine synthase (glutamine-hydrolyzing), partial [Myxococcota bacterium]|nr:asparagine synthase (glutamine-hydrolyzing) [Myxococcota bacterium]
VKVLNTLLALRNPLANDWELSPGGSRSEPMCGIAGVVHPIEAVALSATRRMNKVQAHRGPDDVGTHAARIGGRILALGHRRLSIQDTSPAGHQPMVNPATGDVLVYNGEIYNVAELRSELAAEGVVFRGSGDTEALLLAFERWGIRCLERFCGMFAFGLYAARERKLYLARDPMGIKPLYWAHSAEGGVVFASELAGVAASGLIETRVDGLALESLLAYGAVAEPRTMLQGVSLLGPGTWSEVDLSATSPLRLRSHRYWDFACSPRIERSVAQGASALRSALRESVRSHLVSDVPVAVFLSGGIDSTAIAALAAEARSGDIDTFTVRLAEDPAIDEAPIARRTAGVLGTRHHDVMLGESDALSLAGKWLTSLDQPSVDGLNTYVISGAVRERGMVVALSGLGGDEMFGGYSTFRDVPLLVCAAQIGRHLPRHLVSSVAALWAGDSSTRADKLGDLIESEPSVAAVCLGRRRLMSNAQMEAFGLGAGKARSFLPPECDLGYGVPSGSAWGTVRTMETRFYMGNTLLRDSDVFGMAHGVEIRIPLLDRRVVDAALAIVPGSFGMRRGPNKPWLVAALDGRIPREVLRRGKRGFSLPQARWMHGPLREAFQARVETVAESGCVDGAEARRIWQRFIREPAGPGWSRAWLLGALGEWLARARSDACVGQAPEALATA